MNLPPKLKDTDIITTSISHSAPSLLSLVSKVSAVGDCKSQASSHPEVHLIQAYALKGPKALAFQILLCSVYKGPEAEASKSGSCGSPSSARV